MIRPHKEFLTPSGHIQKGLAAIVLIIGVTNLFNRLNGTTKQVAGAWG